jgi:hypothetical protein
MVFRIVDLLCGQASGVNVVKRKEFPLWKGSAAMEGAKNDPNDQGQRASVAVLDALRP